MNKDQFLYFFALVPPEDIQASVTKIKYDFKRRYHAAHALKSPPHITMIPPFRFHKDGEQLLIKSLDSFTKGESRFQQKLQDFGYFPPRVIFIKVHQSAFLSNLYHRIKEHMEKSIHISSLARGLDRFSPHMTVAFRDLTKRNFFLAKSVYDIKKISLEFEVNGIALLRHNGVHWEIIHKSLFKE
jgi:2'-5' RNA ligase